MLSKVCCHEIKSTGAPSFAMRAFSSRVATGSGRINCRGIKWSSLRKWSKTSATDENPAKYLFRWAVCEQNTRTVRCAGYAGSAGGGTDEYPESSVRKKSAHDALPRFIDSAYDCAMSTASDSPSR